MLRLLPLAVLWPTSGLAEPATSEIVVTGKERANTLSNALEELRIAETGDQLARWRNRPCLSFSGWEAAYEVALDDALNQTFDRYFAGSPNPPGCRPNVEIVLTRDAGKYVDTLRQRAGRLYRQFPLQSRQRAEGSPDAVRILMGARTVNEDGRLAYSPGGLRPPPGLEVLAGLGEVIVQGTGVGNSRIGTSVFRENVVALVIVDFHKSSGVSLSSLADYIALRLLTGASDGAPANHESILDLFAIQTDGSEGPTSFSRFDLALLEGFAELPATARSSRQISALARSMRPKLETTAPD
ncbi:hypothetical protein [Erythrobacter sp.]|uniref:hypothetical protein n=1 Tax=Erythrobacter sp. TaxID=1042 RepID=UPI001B20B0EE|nr:hypothetical protein [Erythrobacter sp.]MBO6525883.1 hypothetical protein [Erythrobacter sp.]MBO6529442.1 hypothetical protein [Erythrobacter sp.]